MFFFCDDHYQVCMYIQLRSVQLVLFLNMMTITMLTYTQRAREAAAAIPPQDMFRHQTEKFSQFDEQGVPTHDADGQVITNSQKKKLRKQWQIQEKKHREYMLKQKS